MERHLLQLPHDYGEHAEKIFRLNRGKMRQAGPARSDLPLEKRSQRRLRAESNDRREARAQAAEITLRALP